MNLSRPSRCLICLVKVEPEHEVTLDSHLNVEESSLSSSSSPLPPPHYPTKREEDDLNIININETDTINTNLIINPTSSILQRQLDVIFLLKNVLKIPHSKLFKYLKVKGNPESWISFCVSCEDLLRNVKDIFSQLQRISKKYDEARLKIEERIKVTNLVKEIVTDNEEDFILDQCRDIVCKRRKLVQVDFHEGDLRAQQLLHNYNYMQEGGGWKHEVWMGDEEEDGEAVAPHFLTSTEMVLPMPEGFEEEEYLPNLDAEGDNQSVSSSSFPSYRPPGSSSSSSSEFDSEDVSIPEEPSNDDDEAPLLRPPIKKKKQRRTRQLPHNQSEGRNEAWNEEGKGEAPDFDFLPRPDKRPPKRRRTPAGIEEPDPLSSWDPEDANNSVSSFVSYTPSGSSYLVSSDPNFDLDLQANSKPEKPSKDGDEGQLEPAPIKKKRRRKPPPPPVKHTCHVCEKILWSEKTLNVHLLRFHNIQGSDPPPTFPCTYEGCGKVFYLKTRLTHHLNWHENVPTCSICNKGFKTQPILEHHQFYKHKISKPGAKKRPFFDCPKCEMRFPYENMQKSHSLTCKGEWKEGDAMEEEVIGPDLNCPCPHCGKVFIGQYKLDQHMKNLHPPDKSQLCCTMCPRMFWRKFQLKLHMAKDHQIGAEKHTCNLCGKFFQSLRRKEQHICGVAENKCDFCEKEFKSKTSLKLHVSTKHENHFDFACDQCAFRTGLRRDLIKHQASIHKIGVKCEVQDCDRYFDTEKRMKDHVRKIHEKEKTLFPCDLCPHGAENATDLRRHRASEHGIGVNCKVLGCLRIFNSEELMEAHVKKVHPLGIRERSFLCTVEGCGKGFFEDKELKNHIQAMHMNRDSRPYKCKFCGKGFSTASYRSHHENGMHKNDEVNANVAASSDS